MNLYPKKINLCQFIPNSCQFMLIYQRFFLTYPVHTPHIDTPAPIIDPKTRICPQNQKKNLKKPNFPQIRLISVLNFVNLRKIFIVLLVSYKDIFPRKKIKEFSICPKLLPEAFQALVRFNYNLVHFLPEYCKTNRCHSFIEHISTSLHHHYRDKNFHNNYFYSNRSSYTPSPSAALKKSM